ncbi:helix-turn-helix domain-containing protein [Gracilibacillus sp. YIM 98692]|uniref:helix-turn-helix domain-containing protein n=1 Tax=Gracilibacillus sp. YIM 98692 TaxID=2663532 RepID=UPI0013D4CB01|nr:helix-turn-helix domain-containing protein [Gracilibacillus sp. YIM 98692]
MIKVMLVDDESIEREGIRMILSRNRSHFDIVAEAQNGKEAVDCALSEKPDIIFMDIKMPEFDGLVAIEKILSHLPNTKCIMVSAFDMFQYAQKAMKFGVKEYLLKPSKVSEVLEAYDRMADEVEKERQQVQDKVNIKHRLERASSLIEMEFIVSLMMDYVHEFSREDWKEWLNLDETKGFVVVFSFHSDQMRPDRNQKSEWYRVLKQSLEQQEHSCFIGPLTGFQVPVFVKCLHENVEAGQRDEFARNVIHDAQRNLRECKLFVGVGATVTDLAQFSRSYEEAVYALELVQSHPSAAYLTYDSKLEDKRKELLPFEKEKALLEAIKQGDVQTGLQAFESYFQWIQKNADYQIRLVKKAVENFFIVLTRVTKELGFDHDLEMSVACFETTTQVKEAAKAHLLSVLKQLDTWRSKGVQGLLINAKEYIESYYHTAITLEEVAEKVGLSSYYLSKLFKEHFQVTFVEYLTNVRIDKAKAFLLNGSTPLKEIALNIGYKDPNYFSRVFKKETGLSPSEYRMKYQ